jgi:hypothetical protein
VLAPVGGRPVVVTIEGVKDGEFGYNPGFAPEDCLFFPGETDGSGRKIFLVQPYKPGVYRVGFVTKGETAFSNLVIDASGGVAPQPSPQPQPNPNPKPPQPDPQPKPPVPTAARIAVVVVEETRNRSVEQGKVLLDAGVRDWLKAGRHDIELLDKDDKAAKDAGYLAFAERVGLPAVLVFDADKTGPQVPLKAFRLPATGADWKTQLAEVVK